MFPEFFEPFFVGSFFYTAGMKLNVTSYVPGDSLLHRTDARVKIVLLLVYSISLFFVDNWIGMAIAALAFLALFFASQLPASRVFGMVVPIYFLVGITVIFNMFVYADPAVIASSGVGQVSIWQLVVPAIGPLAFSVPGLLRGLFYAFRILLLVFASLLVCYTSTSTELSDALNAFLRPLRRFGVPSDDIATIFSIAIRFIPVTAEEFTRVRNAQWSRGSHFDEGSLPQRLKAWQTVFIPLFVGLFRRAESLALAMDSRCYGAMEIRTSLSKRSFSATSAFELIVGVGFCVALAILF